MVLSRATRSSLQQFGVLRRLQSLYIEKYRSRHSEEDISDDKILQLYNDEITKEYKKQSLYYTIAGYVTTSSGEYDSMVFTPGILKTTLIFGFEAPLDLVEFTVVDKLHLDEFRSYVGMAAGASSETYPSNSPTFVMDTSKIDNLLNTLKLLEKLFPVVVAAAVLIGGLVCGLIIIQSSKEVAILRVLGTTRRRSYSILVIERMLLCIIGMAAGACGLLLYKGAALTGIAAEMYLYAALYFTGCLFGSIICSVITTCRKVLELLQTKE